VPLVREPGAGEFACLRESQRRPHRCPRRVLWSISTQMQQRLQTTRAHTAEPNRAEWRTRPNAAELFFSASRQRLP